jgi:predicted NUDIX family NTP pyrophosphohydrolase
MARRSRAKGLRRCRAISGVCAEPPKRFTTAPNKWQTIGRIGVEALLFQICSPIQHCSPPSSLTGSTVRIGEAEEVAAVISAGLLLYRRPGLCPEVFLVHPGGPYWAKKDDGAWSVPKGIVEPHEDEFACARREFREETGFDVAGSSNAHDLGIFRQPTGKRLHIWAMEGDCNPAELSSNLFELEWPPKSGRHARFPEVDRGGWFDRERALVKITKGQRPVVEQLYIYLGTVPSSDAKL